MNACACLRKVGPTTERLNSISVITRSSFAASVRQCTSALSVRPVSPSSLTVVAADFNADGRFGFGRGQWRQQYGRDLLLKFSAGNFILAGTYDSGGSVPDSLAVGDFNRDGKLDLVCSMGFTIAP